MVRSLTGRSRIKVLTLMLLGLIAFISTQAVADLLIVVNKANADNLTAEQVQNIFLGKAKYFPNGKPVIAIQLAESSKVYDSFAETYLHKNANQLRAYWSRLVFTGRASPPHAVKDSAEVVQLISSNPNMIGYLESTEVKDLASVRVIKVQ